MDYVGPPFLQQISVKEKVRYPTLERRANLALAHAVKLETAQPNQSEEQLMVDAPRPKLFMETYMHTCSTTTNQTA